MKKFSMKKYIGRVVRAEWWDHAVGGEADSIPSGTDWCAHGVNIGRVHSVQDGIVTFQTCAVWDGGSEDDAPPNRECFDKVIEHAIYAVTAYSKPWK